MLNKLTLEKKQIKKATPDLKREKLMLMGLISAVAVSFLFTLISIFNETLLKPEYVPADEFERRMEQLREQYILENQKLQLDLKEAQHVLSRLLG